MKILLVGTFLPVCLELSYERSLKTLGCEVRRFDLRSVNRFLVPYWEYVMNKKIYDVLDTFNPDLIFVIKGYYLWPNTIRKIRESKRSLIFCFNGDNPFNLACRGATNRNILESIPHYDCYFIWTDSLIEPLFRAGTKKVECLPFGFDSISHHPMEISETEKQLYSNDIVFVGNCDRERERWLKELVDFDLGIWGDNWKTKCKDKNLQNMWRKKAAYIKDMSRVLNASKVSLNILREQNKGNHNMRTFEAPACGAFVLAQRSIEAKEFFQEDREAVYFSSPKELREKTKYYITHDEKRKKIAQAGYQRCMSSNYSYLERAKKVLKVYEKMRN